MPQIAQKSKVQCVPSERTYQRSQPKGLGIEKNNKTKQLVPLLHQMVILKKHL
jgi:hypothetical protein